MTRIQALPLVLLVALASGCTSGSQQAASRPSPSRLPAASTPAATASPPGCVLSIALAPHAASYGEPAVDPQSITFTSARQGWAWGPGVCTSPGDAASGVLVTTLDAGRHWRLAPSPGVPFSGATSDGHGASAVRFADPLHGYLFGPDLWTTSDGGRHWAQQRPPGPVMRLETRAEQLVALVGNYCASGQSCRSQRLYRLSEGGRQWTPLISQLPREVVNVVLSSSAINLLVRAPGGDGPVVLWRRVASTSWRRVATPCSSMTSEPGALAAWSDQGLALVCAGEPGGGQQMKTFYSSSDGGRHWHVVNTGGSYSGYVGGLAAASSRNWAFAEARGGLRVTHDGGRTWSYATFTGRAGNVEGWGSVQFTDARHAVAVPWTLNGAVLAITADGGRSWQAVAFPVDY